MKPFYQDNAVTIYHGDCREILPGIPKVDLVLTDPPYEITATGGGIGATRKYLQDTVGFTDCGFDYKILDGFENWFCFGTLRQVPKLIEAAGNRRWMLVTWNKPNPCPLVNGNYLPDTEYIIHAFLPGCLYGDYSDKARFIVHPLGDKEDGRHPNEKPIKVISKLVQLGSLPGHLILDPFLGSGTTLRAAKNLGRRAIGIEIEEKYCEIAAKRMAQEVFNF